MKVKKIKDWLKERSGKQFDVLGYFTSSISHKVSPYRVKRIKDDKIFFIKDTIYTRATGNWAIEEFCDDNINIIIKDYQTKIILTRNINDIP